MPRPITLEDFYAQGGLVRAAQPEARAEQTTAPLPARSRSPLVTAKQRQLLVDAIAAAQSVSRLSARAGVDISPGKLGLLAAVAAAAFGGYKWYKSRKRRGLRRRLKPIR